MSRIGKAISSAKANAALFIVAAALLIISVVGTTNAALSDASDPYKAYLQSSGIGVSLLEKTEGAADYTQVAYCNYQNRGNDNREELTWVEPEEGIAGQTSARLLQNLSDGYQVGKVYDERLKVRNTGKISEYVRVSLVKYWETPKLNADGTQAYDLSGNPVYVKDTTLDPNMISINVPANSGWTIDPESTTTERTVYYWPNMLRQDAETSDLTSSVSVSSDIMNKVTQETNADGTITTVFDYEGKRFCVEAEVYAAQEHNFWDALVSAWGRFIGIG